uniref:Uncharacterized protein n=1 Tax=Arundo donax TaxID=35708 RepID=A0A0A9ASI9_ARUDO
MPNMAAHTRVLREDAPVAGVYVENTTLPPSPPVVSAEGIELAAGGGRSEEASGA